MTDDLLTGGSIELDIEDASEDKISAITLTPEEEAKKNQIVEKIDISDATQILQYGSGLQQKMSSFSESALQSVKTKDLEGVGGLITGLVTELRGFEIDGEKKGLSRLFSKAGNQITQLKAKYTSIEKNVDKIAETLEGHKLSLLKDVKMLDHLYEKNVEYFRDLTVYIAAGREKLEQLNTVTIPALREKAESSGLPEDAQEAKHISELAVRFEKKVYDLELTRNISLQMAPQIRLVQENDSIMVDKIQSSIMNTIPLWKNQMVLALGLAHSQAAIKAQREVTDTTNELLKKNADALKQGTIEAAKESERGIVDIETLKYTNESLITTLDEVLQIQDEGRAKRAEAEKELAEIETTLKTKLLELRDKE